EVRDPVGRPREPRDPGLVELGPHLLAQHRLRCEQLGVTAGVDVVARHHTPAARSLPTNPENIGYTSGPPMASIDGCQSSQRSTRRRPSIAWINPRSKPP